MNIFNKKIKNKTVNRLKKFSTIFVFSLYLISMFSFLPISYAQNKVPVAKDKAGQEVSLVTCATSQNDKPCTLNDLSETFKLVGQYIIKIIFPAAFFFGIFMIVLPLLKNPNNPEYRSQAKMNLIKLVIGTLLMVGAYFIIRAVLSSLGLGQGSTILQETVKVNPPQSFNFNIIDRAYAQKTIGSFENPLENTSVQGVLSGIINVMVYVATIGIIISIIRGVMYLVTSQENPENLKKGKTWIIWSLVCALIVFGAQTFHGMIVNTVDSVFNK